MPAARAKKKGVRDARAAASAHRSAERGEERGAGWRHRGMAMASVSLQMNPRRSRCASARTQVSTDGVSISPLHMVARSRSAGIRSTSTYSSASRGSG